MLRSPLRYEEPPETVRSPCVGFVQRKLAAGWTQQPSLSRSNTPLRPCPGGPASRRQTSKALTEFIWLKRGDSSAGVTQALGKPDIHGDLNPASLSHLRAPQVETLRGLQSREALLLAGVPATLDR